VVLHCSGWRVDYIGADTPIGDLARAAAETRPDLAVLAASMPERFTGITAELSGLAAIVPLALAGAGASAALASAVGARLLDGDPVSAARSLVPSSPVSRSRLISPAGLAGKSPGPPRPRTPDLPGPGRLV
jgi:MerR family transcriptional regulator, light-induced transcriptional regulator